MYDNIGGKLKTLAEIQFWIVAIASAIVGIVMLVSEMVLGLLFLLGVPVVAWVASWLLYGFGELVEKVCHIEGKLCNGTTGTTVGNKTVIAPIDSRTKDIMELHRQGMITDGEYEQAMAKIHGNDGERE